MGQQSYLIRYGLMSHVGRFSAQPVRDSRLERGQLVVLQTDRGVELGEVLIAVDTQTPDGGHAPATDPSPPGVENPGHADVVSSQRVLRLASADDLSRRRRGEESRPGHFSLCQRILRDGNWPWPLIDVEPMLDGRSTVLYYLGPHQVDTATLRARFRVECDIDVVLEPVGTDSDEHEHDDDDAATAGIGGGCGSCDCGEGGGCGSAARAAAPGHDHPPAPAASGCAPQAHSGCSSCGIGRLLTQRAGR